MGKNARQAPNYRKASQPTPRAGSNAGRGFRYQDAVAVWLAVMIWSGKREAARVIPEGGDDIELRGTETVFLQVKSRREYLGLYGIGEARSHIWALWNRHDISGSPPDRLELILERGVSGQSEQVGADFSIPITGGLLTTLTKEKRSAELFPKTDLLVVRSPHETVIGTIVRGTGCQPIAAELCYAELLVRMGAMADANGRLDPENYLGLSPSDTDAVFTEVLSAIDIDALEQAITNGVCEPIDFLTPLSDPNFYLGINVEPGHIAAGLVMERPVARAEVANAIETRRAALVVGPSGAGKSALMWETAYSLRHVIRWFRIRSMSVSDLASIRQLARTMRASEVSPVGFVMDDVGLRGSDVWDTLLRELTSVPGIVMLGSIREEDIFLIAERSRAVEVRADPDDELAERLWNELREAGHTSWEGWLEPWNLSGRLLLEYVHILTRGERMEKVLADQVAARTRDPARATELAVLQIGSCAGTSGALIETDRIPQAIGKTEADISRALYRLVEEHLVRAPAPGLLEGLHQLRSQELFRLAHKIPPPIPALTFARTVASAAAAELEPLIADTMIRRQLDNSDIAEALVDRLEKDPDAIALGAALRGLGTGLVSAGVDKWLEASETKALARTQIMPAAMLGVGGMDLLDINLLQEARSAANHLAEIKGVQRNDPRLSLISMLSPSAIATTVTSARLADLDQILAALVGNTLPGEVRSALLELRPDLLAGDLEVVASLLGTAAIVDRDIAMAWVDAVGQQPLLGRLSREIPWTGDVVFRAESDGRAVCCDYWYLAPTSQPLPHDDVVRLCRLLLAVCPSADIAESRAIGPDGELSGFTDLPLANKRIPRSNLPPASLPAWNRRWLDMIARRVATPSYSEYLARGIGILKAVVPKLERVFDAHLRGENAPSSLFENLHALNREAADLTPPIISSRMAAGTGSEEVETFATPFQKVLFQSTENVVTRFAALPSGAGAFIGWLDTLIADIDTTIKDEPWQLIGINPSPNFVRLRSLLDTLRMLAGEAHTRNASPVHTWIHFARRIRPGKVLGHVKASVGKVANRRAKELKAELESAAEEAGINVLYHLRPDPRGILPWPPLEILALVPTEDIATAAMAIQASSATIRSFVDTTIRLTAIPMVAKFAVARFATTGYQTMLPMPGAVEDWLQEIGVPCLPAPRTAAFGAAVDAAGELGAMDRKGFGKPGRPAPEIAVRQKLEIAFAAEQLKLLEVLRDANSALVNAVTATVTSARQGNIALWGQEQNVLDGTVTPDLAEVGRLVINVLQEDLDAAISAC